MLREARGCVDARPEPVQEVGLIPVLCVGETQGEREAKQTEAVVDEQLNAVVDDSGIEAFRTAVIAYEPVWAIGTGLTATPEQAQDVHRHIRETKCLIYARLPSRWQLENERQQCGQCRTRGRHYCRHAAVRHCFAAGLSAFSLSGFDGCKIVGNRHRTGRPERIGAYGGCVYG